MRQITFINPPCHSPLLYFPIGLGYLHEIVKEKGIDSSILDIQNMIIKGELCLDKSFFPEMEKMFARLESAVFAFSIMNSSYPWTIELVKIIGKYHPGAKIVIGGTHSTLIKERILTDNPLADVATIFEGESIIYPLTKALLEDDEEALLEVKNLYVRKKDGSIVFTGEEPLVEDLDKLPMNNLEGYFETNCISLDVGRGCPYNCYFCGASYLWKKQPRYKSARRIAEEASSYYSRIKHLKNPVILFEHDNFLAKKETLRRLGAIKEQEHFEFNYGCDCRIDLLDDEVIDLLEKTSCNHVYFGIESGSKRIQEIADKHVPIDTVIPKLTKLIQRGISVETNYIVGFPEESLEEAFMTIDFASDVKWLCPPLSNININSMTPLPCAPLVKNIKDEDYVLQKDSVYYRQMKAGGLIPENYAKETSNHLYLVRNKNYDILLMTEFVDLYYNMLFFYPVSLYILVKLQKKETSLLYHTFCSHKEEIKKGETLEERFSIFLSFLTVPGLSEPNSLYNEILRYESIRYNYLNKHLMEQQYSFEYDIQNIYKKLKYNPAHLFEEQDYKKSGTVIKFGASKG